MLNSMLLLVFSIRFRGAYTGLASRTGFTPLLPVLAPHRHPNIRVLNQTRASPPSTGRRGEELISVSVRTRRLTVNCPGPASPSLSRATGRAFCPSFLPPVDVRPPQLISPDPDPPPAIRIQGIEAHP
ncbi:hypothetical protein PLICRDRAFT_291229 [Plicaturopsis crispa FD-325 SS-3]|nr:hypothetical protein PLICRDRAFT_291229 [Plicaturopsis crispa FD-325 SS-3]